MEYEKMGAGREVKRIIGEVRNGNRGERIKEKRRDKKG